MAYFYFVFLFLSLSQGVLKAEELSTQNVQKGSEQEASTYGELMLIEKKSESEKSWQLELSGMQEFSNPYLDVNGVSFSVKKSLGPFVYIGPEYTKYYSSESQVNHDVSKALKTDTISQTVYKPRDSVYGVISLLPLSGHLNVLNRTAMPIELEIDLGGGVVHYYKKEKEGAMLWRLGPRAFLTNNIGLQFQFGQEIESPFSNESITKSHARLGIIGRF